MPSSARAELPPGLHRPDQVRIAPQALAQATWLRTTWPAHGLVREDANYNMLIDHQSQLMHVLFWLAERFHRHKCFPKPAELFVIVFVARFEIVQDIADTSSQTWLLGLQYRQQMIGYCRVV